MSADDPLAEFIRGILASPDRMVRVMRERPGYVPPYRTRADLEEAFLELDRQNKSEREIALALHCTTRSVIRLRGRHGRKRQEPAEPRPQSDRDFAARLLEDGCSINETARTLRVDTKTIDRWFPDAGGMSKEDGRILSVAMTRHRKKVGLPPLRSA